MPVYVFIEHKAQKVMILVSSFYYSTNNNESGLGITVKWSLESQRKIRKEHTTTSTERNKCQQMNAKAMSMDPFQIQNCHRKSNLKLGGKK